VDRRFLTVVVLSACFAACVAVFLFRTAGKPRAKVAMHPVVVANVNLPLGTKIKASDVKLVPMPDSMLPKNSFVRVEDVRDRIVTGAMFADEPVVKDRIAAAGAGAGLAPMIAEGQRAVSVRVNDVIGVAGFVQPGMRVDVLVTGRPPGSSDSVTRTVLQNVVVLSAGQVLQAEPKGQAINATVVTLQVSPQEAEVLILSAGEGHIQLVLRNPSDSRHETTSGTLLSSLYGVSVRAVADSEPHPGPRRPVVRKPVEVTTPVLPPPPPARTVEVVRGTKKSLDALDPQQPVKDAPTAALRSAK